MNLGFKQSEYTQHHSVLVQYRITGNFPLFGWYRYQDRTKIGPKKVPVQEKSLPEKSTGTGKNWSRKKYWNRKKVALEKVPVPVPGKFGPGKKYRCRKNSGYTLCIVPCSKNHKIWPGPVPGKSPLLCAIKYVDLRPPGLAPPNWPVCHDSTGRRGEFDHSEDGQ